MINITLPDGKQLQFDTPITVLQVAEKIGARLAKAALAGVVDEQLVDVNHQINKDANLKIITAKDSEGLEIIRHSTAHLMAHAVKNLFPKAKLAIGPTIEDGFYYDFYYPDGFSEKDFEHIEAEMQRLAKSNHPIKRSELSHDEAAKIFHDEPYKIQLLNDIPAGEKITLYQQDNFIDLCRGPHVPNTNFIQAFKLTKLAGAYWRGDAKNEMLQRIYGTAWANKEDLQAYLDRIAEAEKRDHRKIGKAMDLFHTEETAPGMVFWHANGYVIYKTAIQYMRKVLQLNNYQEVAAPLMLDRTIWEKTGHWDKFGAGNMFTTESENRIFAIKPMNCPGHILIFNQGLKSYRDLPFRTAEFGMCHRNEASGTLHGIMRIRQFTQDDAHVFCTKEQLLSEVVTLIKTIYKVYSDFGFQDVIIRLATRPEKRIGEDKDWDEAEQALQTALDGENIKWVLAMGEGAFYGPKIEFQLRDCLQRVWQCGTVQIDFAMPNRLGASYIAEDGSRQVPVMIHRAILGSVERFIGILIEHYAGLLPFWLAPLQAVVLNITDSQAEYAKKITKILQKFDFRVKSDLRNEKIGFKIREHTIAKVPYLLIIGDREIENQTIAVRTQAGEDLGSMSLDAFIDYIEQTHQHPIKNLEE
jgi:threonyl-tRNA synthetase